MNPTIQRYLVSSLTTFVTTAVATLAVQLSAGTIQWTYAFWLPVGAVVLRAAGKAVIETLIGQTGDATPTA